MSASITGTGLPARRDARERREWIVVPTTDGDAAKKNKVVSMKDDNVYRFDKDDFKNLSRRVLMRDDISYQMEPASNRHRGLTPMMISILSIIHKAKKIATSKGKVFHGVTLYDCQSVFKVCGISNDTVRDNIRKLWKNLKFLETTKIRKNAKNEMTYYVLNDDKFPCKDGLFILGDESDQGGNFWAISCTVYPFCSCTPSDCVIIESLKALRNLLTNGYFSVLEQKMKKWMSLDTKFKRFVDGLVTLLSERYPKHRKYFEELTENEITYFASQLDATTTDDDFEAVLEKIKDDVVTVIAKEKKNEATNAVVEKIKKSPLDDIP